MTDETGPRTDASAAERLRSLLDAVEAACPVCHGGGWVVESDPTDETGATPMQVPCWDAEHSVILNYRDNPAALSSEGRQEPDR